MANTPKKAKDPTEAAMSAIQEALNVRDAEMKSGPARAATMRPAATTPNIAAPTPVTATPEAPRRPTRTPPLPSEEDLFDPTRAQPTGEPGRPANDDLRSVGQILQTLQPRSSRTSYLIAAGAAAAWVLAALLFAANYMPSPRESFASVIALALGTIVPVVFFFLLALMINRSREMRLIAQSMAEVAMRLAEPEAVARESIVTVGQAIRREVAAMGDGVERALARAAELESLVHNEVSALERAYNDNEVRIRGLLDDLAHQRDHLVGQAEQVRQAITSVHLDLNQDITGISDMVAQQVNVAAQQITQTLAE